ncbi:MAG TPA: hypothetical protein VGP76_07805 [Planctomycetaceae bacterium]|nr:hypothetical protein [Planctomycetaceae bacterium]
MSGMGTYEIVNLIKSSDHWAEMLKIAKDFRGLSNSETIQLAKQKGLFRSRSADAGIVLEPWAVKDPNGVGVLVSFEICRQQVNVSVETPKGKLEEVTAVIGDEIEEHFERSEGKPQPCPWSRSELRGFVAEIRQLYRVRVVDGQEPRVEKTETKAGRRLSFVARRFRLTGPMQLVLTVYASESDVHAKRVFDPSVADVPDGETLQSWINAWLEQSAGKS